MNSLTPEERDRMERLLEQASTNAADPHLEDLMRTRDRLEQHGTQLRQQDLEAVLAGGPVEGEDAALAGLEAAMGLGPARRTLPRFAVVGLAAAAALLLLWGANSLTRPDPAPQAPGPLLLGPESQGTLLEPVGPVPRLDRFRWEHGPRGVDVHELRLWLGGHPSGVPDLTISDLLSPQWIPDSSTQELLNRPAQAITWQVIQIRGTDQSESVLGSASASLQP